MLLQFERSDQRANQLSFGEDQHESDGSGTTILEIIPRRDNAVNLCL